MTIYLALDGYGPACNVSGDAAIATMQFAQISGGRFGLRLLAHLDQGDGLVHERLGDALAIVGARARRTARSHLALHLCLHAAHLQHIREARVIRRHPHHDQVRGGDIREVVAAQAVGSDRDVELRAHGIA